MKIMKYDKILRTKWTDSDTSGETVPQTHRLRKVWQACPTKRRQISQRKKRIINENKR